MKKIITFLAAATLSLLIASCKKDHVDTPATEAPIVVKFSPEALAYVQLPLNKYFIYKDSATGILDSVVVTQSDIQEQFMSEHIKNGFFDLARPSYNYQTFTLTLTKYNGAPQEWFSGIANNSSIFITSSDTATALYLKPKYLGRVFDYPIIVSSDNYGGGVAITPSIIIESKIYLNVIVFTWSNSLDTSQSNYLKTTYYWVKGTGIIKREIRTVNSIKTDLLVRNG